MTYVRTEGNVEESATFIHQADAAISQANPVSTTLYTVLPTTRNARIISLSAQVTWTVQPDPLEIIVTIDGQTITFFKTNPATNTPYGARSAEQSDPALQALDTVGGFAHYRAFLLEGRSVQVQARTTGGTTSNLTCRMKYAKRTG